MTSSGGNFAAIHSPVMKNPKQFVSSNILEVSSVLSDLPVNGAIVVDGTDGAGKSTLAEKLAVCLQIKHVDLDEYLIGEQKTFVGHIQYKRLEDSLSKSNRCIVSGVCILQIFGKLRYPVSRHIYVKRLAVWGVG